jgi:hypothetical protein
VRRLTVVACALAFAIPAASAYAGCPLVRSCHIDVSISKTWYGTAYGYNTSNGFCDITYTAVLEGDWGDNITYDWTTTSGASGHDKSLAVQYSPGAYSPGFLGADGISLQVTDPDDGCKRTASVTMNVHKVLEYMIDSTSTENGGSYCVSTDYGCNLEFSPSQEITLHSEQSQTFSVEISSGISAADVASLGIDTSQTWTYGVGIDFKCNVPIGYCARFMVYPVYKVYHCKKILWNCDGTRTVTLFTVKTVDHFDRWVDITPK